MLTDMYAYNWPWSVMFAANAIIVQMSWNVGHDCMESSRVVACCISHARVSSELLSQAVVWVYSECIRTAELMEVSWLDKLGVHACSIA